MCELYPLDQANDLKEVESYCSVVFNNIGRSHNLTATISDNNYQINQCAEKVFSSIDTKNVYVHIAQKYLKIQHSRFGCGVRSFVTLLGCMLHYLITLLEQNVSRRNIIQGIQESFEILSHLYRKSGIPVDKKVTLKLETNTGEYLLSKINKYISSHLRRNDDQFAKDNDLNSLKSITNHLCHYKGTNMKEILWYLVEDFMMISDKNDTHSAVPLSDDSVNPIISIGTMLSLTFNPEADTELSLRTKNFKEAKKNMTYLVCSQPSSDSGCEFEINSGILVTITSNTAALLNQFVGLRNCMAQVNCILLTGTCDTTLKDVLQDHMGISVLEHVCHRSLEILSGIMDVDIPTNFNATATACQLLINVLSLTTQDRLILCSLQIPKWMEIFGITYVNLKTVLIRHPSIDVARALLGSFRHNLNRIENALSLGFYLPGGGSLEEAFAKELKARANDTIVNNMDSEHIEQKFRTMLETTRALQLYSFYLTRNIQELLSDGNDDHVEMYDDVESKIGCMELMSQCLTALFSTDMFIFTDNNQVPIEGLVPVQVDL